MALLFRNFLLSLTLSLLAINFSKAQLYQIRLMATKTEVPKGYFDKLKDIGVIYQQEGEDGITKVYLGNYWGRPTADHFLELVKERGFQSAYLTNQQLPPQETHALQFVAVSNLNIQYFPEEIYPHLLIIQKDGIYRLSLGLCAPEGAKIQELKQLLSKMGREHYWMRRLWRPTSNNMQMLLKDTEVIKSDNKNTEELPTIRKNPKAKLRPSKIPESSEQ